MYSLNKEIYFRNIILSGTKENNKKVAIKGENIETAISISIEEAFYSKLY